MAASALLASVLAASALFPDAVRLFPIVLEADYFAAADFDGDGAIDAAFSDDCPINGRGVVFALNDGAGGFERAAFVRFDEAPGPIAAADFTGDGRVDALVASRGSTVLVRNLGDMRFDALPIGEGGIAERIAVADFNGDGIADAAFVDAGEAVLRILLSGPDGLRHAQDLPLGMDFAAAAEAIDLDGDGAIDLLASIANPFGAGDSMATARNDGTGRFEVGPPLPIAASTGPPTAFDATGDGRPDAATTLSIGGGSGFAVLANLLDEDGANEFVPVGPFALPFLLAEAAAGDIDGDGRQDLVFHFLGGIVPALNRSDFEAGTLSFDVPDEPEGLAPERPSAITLADATGNGALDALTVHRRAPFRGLALTPNRASAGDEPFRPLPFVPVADADGFGPRVLVHASLPCGTPRLVAVCQDEVLEVLLDPGALGAATLLRAPGARLLAACSLRTEDGGLGALVFAEEGAARFLAPTLDGWREDPVDLPGDWRGDFRDAVMIGGEDELLIAVLLGESVRIAAVDFEDGAPVLAEIARVDLPSPAERLFAGHSPEDGTHLRAGASLIHGDPRQPEVRALSDRHLASSVAFDGGEAFAGWGLEVRAPDGAEAWFGEHSGGLSAWAVADFNGDGALDAAFAATANDYVVVVLGGGGAPRAQWFFVPGEPAALLAGDWNGNGRIDLAVACMAVDAGGVRFLYSAPPPAGPQR